MLLRCRYIAISSQPQARTALPATLTQAKIITSALHKPHALIALLYSLRRGLPLQPAAEEAPKQPSSRVRTRALVFVSSVGAAHRAALLLQHCTKGLKLPVWELTSLVPHKAQQDAVAAFQQAKHGCARRWCGCA